MFTRPLGGFSESFTASYIKEEADREKIAKERAKKIEQSRTTISEIENLTKTCSITQDKKFLEQLKEECLSIFQTIEEFPLTSSAIELKSKVVSSTNHIFDELKSFSTSTDDEDLGMELIHRLKPLLQKEVNEKYYNFLQAQAPSDDPAFHEFLNIRTDAKVNRAKEEALKEINLLLYQGNQFSPKKNVLLCVDISYSPYARKKEFGEIWVGDLVDDLQKAAIKANTISEALEKADSPTLLQGSYLNGSGLPHLIVVIATDSLHKAKSESGLCGNKEEIWNDAIEGMRRLRKKIVPVRIGSHQTFWPNGKFYHNDFQEDLLTQFPVQRKGYYAVLFNDIIQPLIKTEDLERYFEIVNTFNQKIKNN